MEPQRKGMELSKYIIDLGRPVAYYPSLVGIAGSVNASILLCQILYWTPRTRDSQGWIYKTTSELQEETGLSQHELKTAKQKLLEVNLIDIERMRLDHTTGYRVRQEELNKVWEEYTGKKSQVKEEEEEQKPTGKRRTDVAKRGDLVDMVLDFSQGAGIKKENKKNDIRSKLSVRLKINVDSRKWEDFIDFLYNREEKHGESVDTFIDWSLKNGFNPVYWTPEKMKTLHPQAYYLKDEVVQDFIKPMIQEEDKDYVPMPKGLSKRNLTD